MADSPGDSSSRKIKIALSKYHPALVRVERSDGDPTTIKPFGSRGKWTRVMDAIPDDGTRVEFLDKNKNVMWSHGLDQGGDEPAVEHVKGVAGIDQIFQLVQNANDVAQRRAQEFAAEQQKSLLTLVDVMTNRLTQLEANYSHLLQLAADSSTKPVDAEKTDMEKENEGMFNMVLRAAIDKGIDKFVPGMANGKGKK